MSYDLMFTIFGYIGSSFLSIMTIPQVYLTIKTNKTEDLSINFIICNLFAVAFLLPYSIYFLLYPIIIANFSVCSCNLIILYYCLKNRNK